MKVVVTGGQGFIGKAVVENLLERGLGVVVFDRSLLPGLPEDPVYEGSGTVDFYLGDVRDSQTVEDVVSQADGVINLAALLGTSETVADPAPSVHTNILGALNVFEAVRKYKIPAVQIATGSWSWQNTYAITKHTAERFAFMFNQEFGCRIAVVEATNVYGPFQKLRPVRKAVPNFIERALQGRDLEIFGDGEQILDLIWIRDCAELLVRALLANHGKYTMKLEAGTGENVTATELAKLIVKLANPDVKIKYLPRRPGEPVRSHTEANPATLVHLGWTSTDFTPLRDGLRETIEWYRGRV